MDAVSANRLLASFPLPILTLLEPHLRPVELRHGQSVQKPSDQVDTVYFPTNGDVAGLLERFAQLQQKAQARTGRNFPIVVIQEAGLVIFGN
jgi:hypothetical protein